MSSSRFPLLALVALLGSACLSGQETNSTGNAKTTNSANGKTGSGSAATAPMIMATDPGYRLSVGDEITIVVHGEDDISVARRIDKKTGGIRMPLINEVNLADKTVSEAENFIEQILIERKLLKKPLVNITVRDYATNEVTFTGRGIREGVFAMPREVANIELMELITRYGGLTPNAKSNEVRVYRKDDTTGREQSFVVDYEAMQSSKKNAPKSFLIYPGDRIFVDERLF
jgi:protein involved in polysaccharide export with SLBB domain